MLFFTLVCRKHDDKFDFESDPDDDGKPINDKYVFQQTDDSDSLFDSNVNCSLYDKLDQEELNEARERRMKQIKIVQLLREIASYGMFIWILIVVSYTNKDINSYNYQRVIKNSLSHGPIQLKQVTDGYLRS